MNKFLVCLTLLLSGCYVANGSPSETEFWMKNGKKISYEDARFCGVKVFSALGDRYKFLYRKKQEIGFIEFYKNKTEAEEYDVFLEKAFLALGGCYYELGYRFKGPLYWCLAQDGNNTKTCMENMKYRY